MAVGLRDRAIIAVMTNTFARVGAVVALTFEDCFRRRNASGSAFAKKTAKVNKMPWHHKLEERVDAYIKAARIDGDRNGRLFRAAIRQTIKPGRGAMSRTDRWYKVCRRAAGAGIETAIGCHALRNTGTADYLMNSRRIEVRQRIAGHFNANATRLYDRYKDDIRVGDVERISI
jgi:integrase/recombinase XerD